MALGEPHPHQKHDKNSALFRQVWLVVSLEGLEPSRYD